MKLSDLIRLCAITLLFSLFTLAQEEPPETAASSENYPKIARKVDEFGRIGECDLGSRMQRVRDGELMDDPSAKLYFLLYKDASALPADRNSDKILRMISNKVYFLGIDSRRVLFVEGGFRKEFSTELWIVPEGAEPPEPSETVEEPKTQTDKTYLFDDNFLRLDEEFELDSVIAIRRAEEKAFEEAEARRIAEEAAENGDLEEPAEAFDQESNLPDSANDLNSEEAKEEDLEAEARKFEEEEKEWFRWAWANPSFCDQISDLKNSKGKIIFYADDLVFDISKVRRFIEEGRHKIANSCSLKADRLEAIFGGYREEAKAELWVVPQKGKEPKATPSERKPLEDEEHPIER